MATPLLPDNQISQRLHSNKDVLHQGHDQKEFHDEAPDFVATAKYIRRFISGYEPVSVTAEPGRKRSKMWNYY